MRNYISVLVASLTFVFCLRTSNADELLKSEKELIAWLDGLGYPDLSETPLVKVATGRWTQSGGEPKKNSFVIGFLVAENEADFTVVDLSGESTTHTTKRGNIEPFEAVYYDPLDIVEVANKRIEAAEKVDSQDHWRRFGAMTSETFETVFLARACAAQGHMKTTHELFELATQHLANENRGDAVSLIMFLKTDQAHTRMWRAVRSFGDPDVSLPNLLEKFEDVVDHFPESKHFQRASETSEMLKQMIRESEERANENIPPLDELEGEALVAELIFQLRTQNGHQWSQPGSCDIFTDERRDKSPAARLVAIGFDAVPLLIEAMDDQRFTRSVGFHRDFYFSHHVLRVGDCTEHILRRIAGRNFYSRTYTNGAMVKDGQAKTIKEEVQAWWKEIQTKGEEQVLIDAVASGNDNSANQARVLVKKYPDSAPPAIQQGLAKSENDWVCQSLIKSLAKQGSEEAMEIIKQQLTDAKNLPTRIQAAHVLVQKNQSKAAIDQMIQEWKSYSRVGDPDFFDDPQTQLASFLVHSGSKEAVEAVANNFSELDTKIMFDIVSSFAHEDFPSDSSYLLAVEAFLVDCLTITGEVNSSGSYGDQSFSHPRVCDMAGYILTDQWPKSYHCRLDGTEAERDSARFAAINHWREANGREPIEAPKPFVIEAVADEITAPFIEVIVSNESEEATQEALAKLKQLGPGAIGAVTQLAERTEDSHPFAKQIKQLTLDLPNTITVIHSGDETVEVDQAWLEKLEALKGQTLSSKLLTNLLTDFAKERPCPGIQLKAVRDGNDNGIQLTVEWVNEPAKRSGTQKMWNMKQHIRLGTRTLQSSTGGLSLDYATDSDSHKNLKEPVDDSLLIPNQYMRISISLVIDD